ncbi:hypothetical protein ECHHL_0169 [Ehrlichia chaffeensis str. Heartland]|uniref:Uncharacterized protein n=1 Tax=Ehrlichia chaffeensis (strain ATCC CRL-10679 / Arkansas) TaxID=205920 RepID=Q2GHQ6_EHRCR|nr:hypothetical protein [Ehrlichia chaffeensis]ABD44912.1 hypothetical protein ECH_0203 [Ehrlichia chaffeensis str. Arkansas]AHX03340.1 hypothetical protein ECHHL_0169 [Ehrlichia chaffeensis str. Heartland]AHX05941.1 hypothetical protein ECHJAX_0890 [Ehrlichia chaffeensis str. Jax]AHX06931.1 hypothetical protein ECHLIB_0893 [Ehrlichia chaffeensis str. Liberty]AHX07628.1 hypothetical protein ECHOSC_0175 [Ehrlichia chaffeensis str. Osceola]
MPKSKHKVRKYSTHSRLRNEIFEILSTDPLKLLLVIVPEVCDVPTADNENYRYHSIIQFYTNTSHKTIQDKKKARLLLKLWFKELINKISDRVIIFPEDQKIIDKALNKLFSNFKNISITQQTKDTLFKTFRKIILKSDINPELKEFFRSYALDMSSLTMYTREIIKEITSEITSAMNNPDATLLIACHGITGPYSNNYPNIPISQQIRYLYQHIMKIPPINPKTALNLFPKQHIVFSIQNKLINTRIKLKDHQNKTEKLLRHPYPWYSIINKLKQIIHIYIVKPRITKKTEIIKQIENAFTESIAYGDTTLFFKQLQIIRHNTNISWNPYYKDIKITIRSLSNMEPSAQDTMTIKEFVSNMKFYIKHEHVIYPTRNTTKQHLPSTSYTIREPITTGHNKSRKSNIIKNTKKAILHIAKNSTKSIKNKLRKVIRHKKTKSYEKLITPSTNFTFLDSTSSIKSTHTQPSTSTSL